jgi:hypothetical protein
MLEMMSPGETVRLFHGVGLYRSHPMLPTRNPAPYHPALQPNTTPGRLNGPGATSSREAEGQAL